MHKTQEAIISIHPEFAEAILSGEKTVELRRRIPRTPVGTRLWIYATRPRAAVVGTAVIEKILRRTPLTIWNAYKSQLCIRRGAYDAYFNGCDEAVAIFLTEVATHRPIPIDELREMKTGFHPPQVLARISEAESLYLSKRALDT